VAYTFFKFEGMTHIHLYYLSSHQQMQSYLSSHHQI